MTAVARNTDPYTSQPASRLITIASGKGGVGKTWLSITLAHALASLGNTILLFDGDLGLANVDIQLGLCPDLDLGHVISGQKDIQDALTSFEVEGAQKTKFDILAGRSGSGALSSITGEKLAALRDDLISAAQHYDHVVLDLAAGLDQSVATLCKHSGPVIVVVTSEPTSLTDAYAFIKLTHMRNPEADIKVIVNQAQDRIDGDNTYQTLKKACESFLKFKPKLIGIIPRDDKVGLSIRAQTSTLSRHPQSVAALAVLDIAKALTADKKRPL